MIIENPINTFNNKVSCSLDTIQSAFGTLLYGTPPGWDANKKKPIPGKPSDIKRIESLCKLRGL